MITCKIYVLKHPITNMIFYVGKTTVAINERYNQHVSDGRTRKKRTRVAAYISQLTEPPVIQVIDTIMCNNSQERHTSELESFWIKGLLSYGLPLVNCRTEIRPLIPKGYPVTQYYDPHMNLNLIAC
jgi:hypothetical protein